MHVGRVRVNDKHCSFSLYLCDVTFIISPCEGSSEASASLPVWDLLQGQQGIGKRLSVDLIRMT